MIHTVTEHTLSTGTKGLLIDVPGSEVVSIRLYFRAGYQFGNFSKYEIPHVIEHHVSNGTKNYPLNNQVKSEFRLNGAYNNAFTNPSFIGYMAECAEFEVERILELLTEVVARPLFPEQNYETERENVRTELTRFLSDYDRQAYVLGSEASFPDEVMNYTKRLEQLNSITHDDVVAYYHATHMAHNANFVVTGAIKANEAIIIKKLDQLYSELPAGKRNELSDNIGLGIAEPIVAVEPIDTTYFNLDWYAGGLTNSQRAAGRLLGSILTGGYASRIYGKARDEGLTYHLFSAQGKSPKASSFSITGFCNPELWPRLTELIGTELEAMVEGGPNIDELEAARRMVIGGITLGTQTADDILGWYASDYAQFGTILSFDDYFELLRKVTVKDVQAMAAHYFTSKRHNATLVGKVGKPETAAVGEKLKPVWH